MTSQNNMGSSDLIAMIRIIHHFLLEELNKDTSSISLKEVLSKACNKFDGGYACVGQVGNGDSFVFRDKHGIRPAYFYAHEDFVVAASERIAIQTCFGVKDKITELEARSEEHTSELQSRPHLVCRLLLEKKKKKN